MSFEHLKEKTEDIQDNVKNIINSNIAYYKLWLFKVLMKSTGILLKMVLMLLIFMLLIVFISVALALYLGEIMHSNALGFLSVGGIYTILLVSVSVLKNKLIEGAVLRKFSKIFFKE